MNLGWLKTRTAWQPLTFHGVAAFAGAPLKRLLLVQFIVALLVASVAVWFLDNVWFPTVPAAIRELPSKGEIRGGKLDWPDESPRLLADSRFIAFIADLNHKGEIRVPAHFQVELGRSDVRFISLFGFTDLPYPDRNWILVCNRVELQPWWGAWRPPILWIAFGSVVVGVMLTWAVLSTVFFMPVWLAGFFANRQLNFRQSWRLAGAALMPGALAMVVAILFYGFGVFDLVQLMAAQVAHFIVDLVYVFASPLFAPRLSSVEKARVNPFKAPSQSSNETASEEKIAGQSKPQQSK